MWMPSPLATLPVISIRHGMCTVVAAMVLGLSACSPQTEQAAGGVTSPVSAAQNGGDGIVIVREKRHDHPEAFVAAVRELQSQCFAAKTVVAQAQGWGYDATSEHLKDTEILLLDTERTEEYFEGKKYAKVVTGSRMDVSKLEPTRQGSCKPLSVPYKFVEVDDGNCNISRAHYDLVAKTGSREVLEGTCFSAGSPPRQDGEPVGIAGTTAFCKWSPKVLIGGLPLPTVPECTLLPSPVHEGTGRPLVAIRKSPDHLNASTATLPGTQSSSMLSFVTSEHAVQITTGTRVPIEKFQLPADAALFPVSP